MNFPRPLVFAFLFVVLPITAQQITAQETKRAEPQRDQQAVDILRQALVVAGSEQAVNAVGDYRATGRLVAYQSKDQQSQGTVTLIARGVGQFRMDANLPAGVRSHSISEGRTTKMGEDGVVIRPRGENAPVPSSDGFPQIAPMFPAGLAFPHVQLATALKAQRLSILYKDLAEMDGRAVHRVRVQPFSQQGISASSMAKYRTIDFFIDPATFQVLMTEDLVPRNIVHQIRYSDYKPMNGVLVPFSISEEMGGQTTWTIYLDQFGFNTGLQDSNFEIR